MANTKLEKIHEKADEMIGEQMDAAQKQKALEELLFALGGIKAISALADNLNAARIIAIQRIRDEKLYLASGCTRFDEFMDKHEKSPMPYDRFNNIEKVFKTVGTYEFDLLRGSGLSMRQMKALKAGDVVVEGGEVVIGGDERVSLGEDRKIRTLVEQLIADRKDAETREAKTRDDLEKSNEKNRIGEAQNERLRRELDEADTSRIQRAYLHALNAQLLFVEAVGELDDDEKAERGPEDLKFFAGQFYRLADAYGVSRPLSRQHLELEEKVAALKPVEEMTETEKKETFTDRAIAKLAAEGFDDDLD